MLENPIPVTFKIKMETDKAHIVTDVTINSIPYIKETVLPKMYTIITKVKKTKGKPDVINAFVEKWVIKQRKEEATVKNIEENVAELLEDVPVTTS